MDTQYDGRLIESLIECVSQYPIEFSVKDTHNRLSNLMDSANELRVQRGQQPWEGSHA